MRNAQNNNKQGYNFVRRVRSTAVIVAVAFGMCVAQLVNLQLFSNGGYAQAATSQRTISKVLPAQRGTIVDANGKILAQSVQRYTVFADQVAIASFKPVKCTGNNEGVCHQINGKPVPGKGAQAVAEMLAPVLGMDEQSLEGELKGTNRYQVLKKNVVPRIKRNIDNLNISSVIGTELTTTRSYPYGTLLGSVIGSVNDADEGVSGVESMENSLLSGTNGAETYQRGGSGEMIPGTQTVARPAINGGKVKLTIDADTQWYVEKALRDGQKQWNAKWGIAVVQEVKTGKLVAVADTDVVDPSDHKAALQTSRVMTSTFEPGSTGKVLTVAGLLENNKIQPDQHFVVPNAIDINGQQYHDATQHSTRQLTIAGILQISSNVGTLEASANTSAQERYEFLRKMGIGTYSGIGFPGESSGLLSNWKQWDGRQENTVVFGQGYATTALQMVNAYSTIANGGVRMQQSLVESSTSPQGTTVSNIKKNGTRVLSEKTSSQLMDMMESVTDGLEATKVKLAGYRIAGKSGTAEVADPETHKLSHIIADWIGIIPAEKPQYTIMVIYMDPSFASGGWVAGPVMSQIGQFLMQKNQTPNSPARTSSIPTTW